MGRCLYFAADEIPPTRPKRPLRPPVNDEFNWWLLIVGLGIGAGLAWLILSDLTRRDEELEEGDLADEIAWVGEALAASGRPTSPETVGRVLDLHRAYVHRRLHGPDEEDAGGG